MKDWWTWLIGACLATIACNPVRHTPSPRLIPSDSDRLKQPLRVFPGRPYWIGRELQEAGWWNGLGGPEAHKARCLEFQARRFIPES